MEDTFGKIIGALAVLAAVVFDWPHALAGAIYGFFVRRATFGYPLLALVAGVVVIAGLGELIYPLIGRTAAAITVTAECIKVEGRRITFHVRAHDGIDVIGEGEHVRMVVNWEKFEQRVNDKAKAARVAGVTRKAG